jgi:hypothetical protein
MPGFHSGIFKIARLTSLLKISSAARVISTSRTLPSGLTTKWAITFACVTDSRLFSGIRRFF